MPGTQVKDWDTYHALRRKGHSKESAARIANSNNSQSRKITKHPGPDGSPTHATGTDQSIHSGGHGVSMAAVSRKKLTLRLDPSPERAKEVRRWALDHIDRIRATDPALRHESRAGSTIQRLNNLYYTADNIVEENPANPANVEVERIQFEPRTPRRKHPFGPIVAAVQQGSRVSGERFGKREVNRTPTFPHGPSILWPKVYRGLRRRGMSKEQAARISNAAANKFRGGRRLPLSRTAAKKPIPDDVLDKRPDLIRKGSPDVGDVHTDGPLSIPPARARGKRRKKKNAKSVLTPRARVLQERFHKHLQGQHDQTDHGRWARGSSAAQITTRTLESGDPRSGNRGSSTYVPTGEEPSSGFGVGTPGRGREFASQPSVRVIRDYMRENRDLLTQPDYVFGTWESPEGSWWLDVSRVLDTPEKAWEWGPNEEAIFDYTNLESIFNPSLGD